MHLDMDTMAPFHTYNQKTTGSYSVDISAGDFNHDGKDDFVVANRDADTVSIYYQQSNGQMGGKKC